MKTLPEIPIQRRTPLLGPEPDWSRVLYPDPPSHDFTVLLIIAELMRRHHCAPAPLKVRLLFENGQMGAYDYGANGLLSGYATVGSTREYGQQMIPNVIRPAIRMIGAVEEPDLHMPIAVEEIAHYCEYDYHIWQLVDAGRMGFEIPKWNTPPQWARDEVRKFLKGERPVVITLREAGHQRERNSQIPEWLKFAEEIKKDFPVLFIRDTTLMHFPFGKWRTWPYASSNVFVRAALAQEAYCNMFTSNGPHTWCQFSEAPYLIFKQLVPALPTWQHGHPIGWKEQAHMEVGDQYPWANNHQKLTWTDDTFENISAAFEEFRGRKAVAA